MVLVANVQAPPRCLMSWRRRLLPSTWTMKYCPMILVVMAIQPVLRSFEPGSSRLRTALVGQDLRLEERKCLRTATETSAQQNLGSFREMWHRPHAIRCAHWRTNPRWTCFALPVVYRYPYDLPLIRRRQSACRTNLRTRRSWRVVVRSEAWSRTEIPRNRTGQKQEQKKRLKRVQRLKS